MVDWIVAHQAVVAAVVVAIADLVIALVPNVESNGIFHAIYIWVKSLIKKDTPPAI